MLLLLRIVLLLLVIRALVMLVRGVIAGASGQGKGVAQPRSVQLVRDPVCGVYVSPSNALTEKRGVGTAYFCSEKCRRAWISR